MNATYLSTLVVESLLSLLLFIFIAWAMFRLVVYRLKQMYKLEDGNIVFVLYIVGMFMAESIVLSAASDGFINTMKIVALQQSKGEFVGYAAGYLLGIFTLSILLLFIFHIVTTYLHGLLLKSSLFEAIAEERLASGIFALAMFLSLAFLYKDIIVRLLDAVTPYPSLPGLH
jgi:hypothetical protein